MYGDMGTVMPLGFKVFQSIVDYADNTKPIDLVFHIGDISYAGVDTEVKLLNVTKVRKKEEEGREDGDEEEEEEEEKTMILRHMSVNPIPPAFPFLFFSFLSRFLSFFILFSFRFSICILFFLSSFLS